MQYPAGPAIVRLPLSNVAVSNAMDERDVDAKGFAVPVSSQAASRTTAKTERRAGITLRCPAPPLVNMRRSQIGIDMFFDFRAGVRYRAQVGFADQLRVFP